MILPILYHNGSKGELRSIEIWTEGPVIYTKFGVVDGKMQTSTEVAVAKNVGRSNATTPEQQAELDAKSKWEEKLRKKYRLDREGAEKSYQPMLAKPYDEKLIKFPGYMQPKLDGLRCIVYWVDDHVVLMSRGNKQYFVEHIQKSIEVFLPKHRVLDGEIYVHGQTLETINSWTPTLGQSVKPETSRLEYHIYDNIDIDRPTETFAQRKVLLTTIKEIAAKSNIPGIDKIKAVQTELVNEAWELDGWEESFINLGYEGAIFRTATGLYKFGSRSSDLIKIKRFEDSEFRVLDVIDGVGKFVGLACFVCQNDITDATFECTCKVTQEEKAEQFRNREKLIGKMLTVQHIGRTAKSIPRNPIGKCFRLLEDLDSN